MPSRSMMQFRMNDLIQFMGKELRRNKDVDYLQLLAIAKPIHEYITNRLLIRRRSASIQNRLHVGMVVFGVSDPERFSFYMQPCQP